MNQIGKAIETCRNKNKQLAAELAFAREDLVEERNL